MPRSSTTPRAAPRSPREARPRSARSSRGSREAGSQGTISRYAELVAALERLTAGADEPKRAGAWAAWIEGIVSLMLVETETDLEALAALSAITATLRRSDGFARAVRPETIVDLLAAAPDLEAAPAAERGVWLGDAMSLRGRSFDHLFAIAMQQELFPQRRTEDLLFPNRERRRAGVREIDDGRLEERLLFRLLGDAAAQRLCFSWSAGDGLGKSWRPSMFLKQLALSGTADPDERQQIVSSFERWVDARAVEAPRRQGASDRAAQRLREADRLPPLARRQLRVLSRAGRGGEFDGFLLPGAPLAAAVSERLGHLSASRLETFGHCPQHFLLKTVFGIREVEDPEVEMEITLRKRGILDHEILERFYRDLPEREIESAAGAVRLPDALRERLARLVGAAFDEYDVRYPPPSRLLRRAERRLTLRNLERFLLADLDELASTGYRPWRFEVGFGIADPGETPEHDAARIDIEGREIVLRGRIDRIDRKEGGSRLRIVDYKGGKGAKFDKLGEQIDKGRSLQLALYALAAMRIFDLGPESIEAAIKPIRATGSGKRFSFLLAENHATIVHGLALFLRAMLEGRFPAIAGSAKNDHCRYCVAASWCRTRHTPEEAWALRRFDSALSLLESLEGEARP